MEILRIRGGRRLEGQLDIAGSKNAALALLSAVVLAEGTTVLHNLPDVTDIRIKAELLADLGAKVEWHEGSLFIDCTNIQMNKLEESKVRLIRTSFYLLGPLLARIGHAALPAPGGCKIGQRPVDFHLKGLELLGANVSLDGGIYRGEAKNGLIGAEIYLDFPSAGATQHLLCAAVLAKGCTVIQNAAVEPEVTTLCDFLIAMGAQIEGVGTGTITITGVKSLKACEFTNPADRLQAGTYLLAGAITRGDVTVRGILPEHQTPLINKLREMGCDVDEGHDYVRVYGDGPQEGIRVRTMPYPGFPTDMQQPMAAVLTLANGLSVIEETIYESRTGHVSELARMGAKIRTEGNRIVTIEGVKSLKGARVEASDLRAGAALVLAGLAAEGETHIHNIHWIDRGYEDIEGTLESLGASVVRQPIELDKSTEIL